MPLCRLDGPWRPDALFRSYRHLRRRCDDEGPRHDRPRNRRWVLGLTGPESRTLHTGLSGIAAQAAMDRVRASPLRQLLGVVGATGSVPGLKHTLNIRRQRGWRSKASATGFRRLLDAKHHPPLPFANLGPTVSLHSTPVGSAYARVPPSGIRKESERPRVIADPVRHFGRLSRGGWSPASKDRSRNPCPTQMPPLSPPASPPR